MSNLKKRIIKLERFIKLFNPVLVRIDIKEKINGDKHNVNLIFVYRNDWMLDYEYESYGIKQLVFNFGDLLNFINRKNIFIFKSAYYFYCIYSN